MKKFLVFWKNGEYSELEGETIQRALINGGYSLSSISQLSQYVENGKLENYEYHEAIELWLRKK